MAEHVRDTTMESDLLFKKYTIDEIRVIEKKTRQDIESKKEELRQMVGERYRDLIEAADTITDMKNSAQRVTLTISRMQELCHNMKTAVQPSLFVKKPLLKNRISEEQSHYSVAAQIKLLLDMPEKMWSALDSQHHLRATSFFLLARHINTSLQLDAKQSAAVLRLFPVLTRQWAAISHFRSTILQTCREKLKMADVTDQVACECLCSVLLLEDSTPRQVFNEFLLARTSAVQEQLRSDSSRVKDQVCEVMRILTATLHQIYALFYCGQSGEGVTSNLLMQTLNEATDKTTDNTVLRAFHDTSLSAKYLPDNVKEFRPSPRNEAKPIEVGTLQSNSQEWIEACRKTVNTGVTRLLGFVSSVKGLAAIRNQIWELLQQDEKMRTWNVVCEQTLNRSLSLWEEFLQPLFSDRAKVILQSQFDSTLDSCKQQVARVMTDVGNFTDKSMQHERDLSRYVWQESVNDLPSNTAWVPLSTRTLTDSGALVMKARAYTPAVQSLCKSFDSKLKVLLEDSDHYTGKITDDLEKSQTDMEESRSQEPGPFEKYADKDVIFNFLETSCEQCVSKLLHHLKQQLYACKQQLSNSTDVVGNKTIIDRILLLARFISALSELGTYLQQCVVCSTDTQEQERRTKKSLKGQGKVAEHPQWGLVKSQLTAFCLEAYSAWISHTSGGMLKQFEAGLSDNRGQAVLHSLTKWDEVEIEEETEEGKTVKSVIRVPMQPSWYVQSLLYNVCEEINRIGGHALHRSTLKTLSDQISSGLADIYTGFVKDTERTEDSDRQPPTPFSQTRALQVWFDLRFLLLIFPRKEDSAESKQYQKKMQKAQETVESHVDPFDFDVFTPYMYSHLNKQNQRCQVLYGALTSLDRHASYMSSTKPSSTGQQEQHNVLPLTYTQNRFPLLPLSMTQQKTGPTVVEPPKPKNIPRHSVCLGELNKPPLPTAATHRKQSLLDTMSTMWFNKT